MKVKAAVFNGPKDPFEIREFPLPEIEPGGLLVKVRMATICGSDMHTWLGKRKTPLPIILGHEIVGQIEKMGKDPATDIMGQPLSAGDRITWAIAAYCGRCYYCAEKNIPQKCLHIYKYGHESCQHPPYLNGGFAECIYLRPGTKILRIPEGLSDEEVVPINCALSTVINGLRTIEIQRGDNIVIQGAGMLGINATALLREKGANKIIVLDKNQERLNITKEFGADETINTEKEKPSAVFYKIKDLTNGYGADVVIEVCGNPEVIPPGIEMLRIGGRYLCIGTVFPNANFTLDGYLITTRMITIKGIHNYNARDLEEGVSFIAKNHNIYPFSKLVTASFNLEEADRAFTLSSNQQAIRVAIVP